MRKVRGLVSNRQEGTSSISRSVMTGCARPRFPYGEASSLSWEGVALSSPVSLEGGPSWPLPTGSLWAESVTVLLFFSLTRKGDGPRRRGGGCTRLNRSSDSSTSRIRGAHLSPAPPGAKEREGEPAVDLGRRGGRQRGPFSYQASLLCNERLFFGSGTKLSVLGKWKASLGRVCSSPRRSAYTGQGLSTQQGTGSETGGEQSSVPRSSGGRQLLEGRAPCCTVEQPGTALGSRDSTLCPRSGAGAGWYSQCPLDLASPPSPGGRGLSKRCYPWGAPTQLFLPPCGAAQLPLVASVYPLRPRSSLGLSSPAGVELPLPGRSLCSLTCAWASVLMEFRWPKAMNPGRERWSCPRAGS